MGRINVICDGERGNLPHKIRHVARGTEQLTYRSRVTEFHDLAGTLAGRASITADERSENKAVKATVPLLFMTGCPKPIRVFPRIVSPVFAISDVCVKMPAPPGYVA